MYAGLGLAQPVAIATIIAAWRAKQRTVPLVLGGLCAALVLFLLVSAVVAYRAEVATPLGGQPLDALSCVLAPAVLPAIGAGLALWRRRKS